MEIGEKIDRTFYVNVSNKFRLIGLKNIKLFRILNQHIKKLQEYINIAKDNVKINKNKQSNKKLITNFQTLKKYYMKLLENIKLKDSELNKKTKLATKLSYEDFYSEQHKIFDDDYMNNDYEEFFNKYYEKFGVDKI